VIKLKILVHLKKSNPMVLSHQKKQVLVLVVLRELEGLSLSDGKGKWWWWM